MVTTPPHLGGHNNKTHVDEGVLKYFYDVHNCRSLIDVGCGPGGQMEAAQRIGYTAIIGIDGDPNLVGIPTFIHDYTTGPLKLMYNYDLAWSCEFVEHVEERYIPNFMATFDAAKWVAMTYHPKSNTENPHHFNEQNEDYWLNTFKCFGWNYDDEITQKARRVSKQHKPFFAKRGLVFKK